MLGSINWHIVFVFRMKWLKWLIIEFKFDTYVYHFCSMLTPSTNSSAAVYFVVMHSSHAKIWHIFSYEIPIWYFVTAFVYKNLTFVHYPYEIIVYGYLATLFVIIGRTYIPTSIYTIIVTYGVGYLKVGFRIPTKTK